MIRRGFFLSWVFFTTIFGLFGVARADEPAPSAEAAVLTAAPVAPAIPAAPATGDSQPSAEAPNAGVPSAAAPVQGVAPTAPSAPAVGPVVPVSVGRASPVSQAAPAPKAAASAASPSRATAVKPSQATAEAPTDLAKVRHGNIGLGVGAGVAQIKDSQNGKYTAVMGVLDVTSFSTFFGKYGLSRLELDVGKADNGMVYVNLVSNGMGGWQVVGRHGIWDLGALHLGIEPLNVAARGGTPLVAQIVSDKYKSREAKEEKTALDSGATPDQVVSGRSAALNTLRDHGVPLDANGNVPHAVNYFEAVPSISVGAEKMICGTGNILALARGGVGLGTMGSHVAAPAYGAGLYVDCGVFHSALELTHVGASGGSTDLAGLTTSVNFSKYFAVGVDAQAVHESSRTRSLPSFAPGDGLTGLQSELAVRLAR